jgi:two-component system sensor histidine kinase UhpB
MMSMLKENSKGGLISKLVMNALHVMLSSSIGRIFHSKDTPISQTPPVDIAKVEHHSGELLTLRKAVEASGEVIFMTDKEGIITYVNPEFTILYGYEAKEIIGKTTPRILKSCVMKERFYEQFWETLLRKQIVKGEFVNKCKDGTLVTVEGSANPIEDDQDEIIGFLAIQRDISERKRAEESVEVARLFQQSIIDGIADPIMVIGTDYQVTLMNQAAKEFATNGRELIHPLLCYQISHGRDEPCDGMEHPCPLSQVQESGKTIIVEHNHYQANGESRLVEVAASPYWGANDTVQGIIEVIRDITERVRAKEQLQQYTERLRALAAQIAEVEEMERQRLAQELHDQVGQNLTALGINLNIIRTQLPEALDESVHFHLGDSVSLIEQTAEQIRNLMANLRPPVLDDYGLLAALRWLSEQFARRMAITVTVDGEAIHPRLAARVENALFRIVQEALTNIAKHAQASRVSIKLASDSQSIHLEIADNGIGFDLSAGKNMNGEMGWGLMCMTERAEAVNGRFSVESVPGYGTKVIVDVKR